MNSENEWQKYLSKQHGSYGPLLELITTQLYDTQIYQSGITKALRFFVNPAKHRSWTNMDMAGCLPNPKAFLIDHIRINGISTNIQFGACMLIIGSKHYGIHPAWTYGMKEKGMKLRNKLLIQSLQDFCFQIEWEISEELGNGLSDLPIKERPIQVVLYGEEARAISVERENMILRRRWFLRMGQRCFICRKSIWFYHEWYSTPDNRIFHCSECRAIFKNILTSGVPHD